MENNTFNIQRVYHLINRYIKMHWTSVIIGTSSVVALLLVILVLTALEGKVSDTTFFGITMPFIMLGGYLFSSLAYPELNSPVKGYFYLTLPASALERLTAGWFMTSIMYSVISLVIIYLLSLLLNIFEVLVMGYSFQVVDPAGSDIYLILGIYFVTQTIFLTGAAYFRRFNFFKTILVLFVVSMIVSIYSGLLGQLLFRGGFQSGSFPEDFIMNGSLGRFFEDVLPVLAKTAFWGLMAPFFLVVTYFRIKEREV
jgi:hypothetical protein